MPRGVGNDFLRLLQGEQDSGRTRAWVAFSIGVVLIVPAWFLWSPYGLAVHVGAWCLGIGIGALWGGRTARGWEDSLRGTWNRWMRLAPACESVPELARKVRGRSQAWQATWTAAALTTLWATELLLVLLAMLDTNAPAFAVPIIAANGLAVGLASGHFLRLLTWTRSFRRSLDEMVRDGEIGVWGAIG